MRSSVASSRSGMGRDDIVVIIRAVENPGQQRPPGGRFEGVEDPVAWVGREAARPRPRTSLFDQKTFRHTSDARRANPWSARLRRSLTARHGCLTDRPLPPLR